MNIRVVAAVLLALAIGAGAGYAVAAQDEPEAEPRKVFADPAPLRASDPRLPVPLVAADPDDPQLPIAVDLDQGQRLTALAEGKPTKARLVVPVPTGWTRYFNGVARWTFKPSDIDENAYFMRVDVLTGPRLTVERAVGARRAALSSTEAQGNISDLEFTSTTTDGFVATYIDAGGYRRFSMERFFSGPDPGIAYATVAVLGREQDEPGMADLLERVSIGLRAG